VVSATVSFTYDELYSVQLQ